MCSNPSRFDFFSRLIFFLYFYVCSFFVCFFLSFFSVFFSFLEEFSISSLNIKVAFFFFLRICFTTRNQMPSSISSFVCELCERALWIKSLSLSLSFGSLCNSNLQIWPWIIKNLHFNAWTKKNIVAKKLLIACTRL